MNNNVIYKTSKKIDDWFLRDDVGTVITAIWLLLLSLMFIGGIGLLLLLPFLFALFI